MSDLASFRCAAASQLRGDPMTGSAPVARRWVLIEHHGPWAKQPLQSEGIPREVAAQIEQACEIYHGKPLLVRRHSRQGRESTERMWCVVDTVEQTWVRGTWSTPSDLLEVCRVLSQITPESASDAEDMVLVCTHATRDACCAVRGRPSAARLARAFGDEVWECSHLGGHRFAATMLVLPDGTCYGRVDLGEAEAVVRDHRAGRVQARLLRGVTRFGPHEQSAVAQVLLERGPAPATAARIGTTDRDGDTRVIEVLGVDPLPERTLVEVRTQPLEPAPLSCGADPKPHTAYPATILPDPDPDPEAEV